jgi:hypothetical protein
MAGLGQNRSPRPAYPTTKHHCEFVSRQRDEKPCEWKPDERGSEIIGGRRFPSCDKALFGEPLYIPHASNAASAPAGYPASRFNSRETCIGPHRPWPDGGGTPRSLTRHRRGRAISQGGKGRPGAAREVKGAERCLHRVKAYAARLGLDADAFSGHSLRSGFLTSAAARGASLFKMMDVSRHKSVDVLRGYVRDAEAFRDHAGAGLL